jgi:carbon monoxide dehydrogenase subunit G
MLIENEFTVKRPVDEVWSYLLDVEKIAPCMPGAELTETVDDHTWNGKVNMAFGPVKMSFAGSVSMQERDDAAHRVALKAKGTEQKGKGAANATVTSWLEAVDEGTKVSMQADITLTGAAAQLSRGLLPEVSRRLTQQFADCLEASLAANASVPGTPEVAAASAGEDTAPSGTTPAPAAAAPVVAKPVGGIRLGLAAVWSMIAGFFRKLFGGGSKKPS